MQFNYDQATLNAQGRGGGKIKRIVPPTGNNRNGNVFVMRVQNSAKFSLGHTETVCHDRVKNHNDGDYGTIR